MCSVSFEFLSTVVGVNLAGQSLAGQNLAGKGVAGLPVPTVTSQKQGTGYDTNLTIGSGCVFSTECSPLMGTKLFQLLHFHRYKNQNRKANSRFRDGVTLVVYISYS